MKKIFILEYPDRLGESWLNKRLCVKSLKITKIVDVTDYPGDVGDMLDGTLIDIIDVPYTLGDG